MKRDKFVYFIRQVGGIGNIKIGCSYSTIRRLGQLASWSPEPLEILVTIPGDGALERKIQECFLDSLSHHEWFRPSVELLSLIEKLRAGIPLESAIDLSSGKHGGMSAKQRAWDVKPDARLRCCYTHRFGWYARKMGQDVPQDVRQRFERWYRGDVTLDRPTDAELIRFDEVLTEAKKRRVPRSVLYPYSYRKAA